MIDYRAVPIRNYKDEIISEVLTMRDISALKQAEIELSEVRHIVSNSLTLSEKEILQLVVNGSSA